jgi:hypothetical protein
MPNKSKELFLHDLQIVCIFLLAYLWYHPLGLIQLMTDHIFTTKHWINIQILYREFSSENFDYYGITDETLCHYAS